MPNFVFAYHGGSTPSTPEEGAAVMKKWTDWMGSIGESIVDGGAPVGPSHTVGPDGVAENGGANPLSGYSIIKAADMAAATKIAGGCPILEDGGTVEVAEAMEM